jgi:hypothetical protein
LWVMSSSDACTTGSTGGGVPFPVLGVADMVGRGTEIGGGVMQLGREGGGTVVIALLAR